MAINASIRALISGERIAGSRLNGKLLDELLEEGLLLAILLEKIIPSPRYQGIEKIPY